MIDFEKAHSSHLKAITSVIELSSEVESLVAQIKASVDQGGKVLWCGNGGSAADAQHMAAELMVRYVKNRAPMASIALTTDSSLLTAHVNDFEFETVFSRQVEALAKAGDVVIGISTSGQSENVVKALQQAKKQNCVVVAMVGAKPTPLKEIADFCFAIPVHETARIQEAHSFLSHLICEGLDANF